MFRDLSFDHYRRARYQRLLTLTREDMLREAERDAQQFAFDISDGVFLRIGYPDAADHLRTVRRFASTPQAVLHNAQVRQFIAQVIPSTGDARLPLMVRDRNFVVVVERLRRMDDGCLGRAALLNAMAILAIDHKIIVPP